MELGRASQYLFLSTSRRGQDRTQIKSPASSAHVSGDICYSNTIIAVFKCRSSKQQQQSCGSRAAEIVRYASLLASGLAMAREPAVAVEERAAVGLPCPHPRAPWATWWEYNGEAGPQNWGLINPAWRTCHTGKFQSPIDIQPQNLLFDPNLRRMTVNVPKVLEGRLVNTGNDLTLRLSADTSLNANFSDGPLLYTYRLQQLQLHFGETDLKGSEHSVEGYTFAAELQFVAYNTDLYENLTEAMQYPYGVAIIAVLVEASEEDNIGFRTLVDNAKLVPWQGQTKEIEELPADGLVPVTNYYVTYEGSFTQPACLETVTWVLFNRPIHVSRTQLDTLRQFQKRLYGEESVAKLAGNHRPTMPVNNRPVRTNINYPTAESLCTMKKKAFFQVNPSLTAQQH
ncbi:carbonic anhydrase-related protein 10-like [Babylonia areolata]|uniref:carbonic anhydrase-related protein 10-like n=1 Tax=Babylonia areolata TaxID=304850 RepID=UPI003FD5BE89